LRRESSPHIGYDRLQITFAPEIVEQEHQKKPFRICVSKQMSVDPDFFRHNSRHFNHHDHPARKSGCPPLLQGRWRLSFVPPLPLAAVRLLDDTDRRGTSCPVEVDWRPHLIPVCELADGVLVLAPLSARPGVPVGPAPPIRSPRISWMPFSATASELSPIVGRVLLFAIGPDLESPPP
jgi:hypothetical protein